MNNDKYKDYKEGKEYARMKLNDTTDLVVRQTFYKDFERVDIRVFITSEKFKGWGKGIVIPINNWKEFKEMISKLEVK